MELTGKRIGYCVTGSFCTIEAALPAMKQMKEEGALVTPIFSEHVYEWDTRYFKAKDLIDQVYNICGRLPLHTIPDVEPIGPKRLLDMVVIAPCTGNTMAKLVYGIIDTPVVMAAKSHLRNNGPVVIALASNDGLSNGAKNLGMALNMKNVYLVPFEQDNSVTKPTSLIARMELIVDTAKLALDGQQMQPLLYLPQ